MVKQQNTHSKVIKSGSYLVLASVIVGLFLVGNVIAKDKTVYFEGFEGTAVGKLPQGFEDVVFVEAMCNHEKEIAKLAGDVGIWVTSEGDPKTVKSQVRNGEKSLIVSAYKQHTVAISPFIDIDEDAEYELSNYLWLEDIGFHGDLYVQVHLFEDGERFGELWLGQYNGEDLDYGWNLEKYAFGKDEFKKALKEFDADKVEQIKIIYNVWHPTVYSPVCEGPILTVFVDDIKLVEKDVDNGDNGNGDDDNGGNGRSGDDDDKDGINGVRNAGEFGDVKIDSGKKPIIIYEDSSDASKANSKSSQTVYDGLGKIKWFMILLAIGIILLLILIIIVRIAN